MFGTGGTPASASWWKNPLGWKWIPGNLEPKHIKPVQLQKPFTSQLERIHHKPLLMPFPPARGSASSSFLCHPVKADTSWLCKTLLVWDVLKLPENNTLFRPGRIPTLWVLFEIFFSPPAAWDKVVCASRVMTAHELLPSNTSSTTR